MSQRCQVEFGDTRIDFELTYGARKTLEISVHPDLTVAVIAPEGTTVDVVEAKVRQRAPWILRQQRDFELYLPHTPPRRYVSGETHRYLGRQYRLKVVEAKQEHVKLTRGYLIVEVQDTSNAARVQQLVEGWYRKQAERVFNERLENLVPRFKHLGLSPPTLAVKKMTSRWGSCTEGGTITLNLMLMQVPKQYIDYVIVHELCHLVEHNHSQRFYQLLDRTMPDWRDRRQGLNECEFG